MHWRFQQLAEILKDEGEGAALRFAAGMAPGLLGTHKDIIQRAWSAYRNPNLYNQMGQDPVDLYRRAMMAIQTLLASDTG